MAVSPQAFGSIVTAGSGASLTPSWPTHLANDIGVLIVINSYNTTTTPGTPAGWTLIGSKDGVAGGVKNVTTAWWKRAVSGAETAPSVTTPATDPCCAAQVVTFRGALTSATPIEAVATAGSTVGTFPSLTMTSAGATTLGANRLVVNVLGVFLGGPTGGSISGSTNASVTISEMCDGTAAISGETLGIAALTGTKAGAGVFGATTGAVGASSYASWGVITFALIPAPTAILGRGPDGAALFALDIEDGGEVEYAFATDIIRALDGKENRTALIGCPREAYTINALVDDAQVGAFMAQVMRYGANAEPVLVALPYEALGLSVATTGTTLTVPTTTMSDWCYIGSRVVVVAHDGVTISRGVIQSFTATTIVLDTAVGAAGLAGALVMPTMACYLEQQQTVEQYAVNVSRVSIRARAILFGDENSDWDPQGGPAVTTYTDPESSAVIPVWDRRIVIDELTAHSQLLGNEIVDRGGVLMNIPMLSEADAMRDIRFTIHESADRQWFKRFIGTVVGRQKAFLLPTWKPDLIPLSDASTGVITCEGPPDAMNYALTWFTGTHRWIQIVKTDGTIHYRKVQDAADNLDGTQDILLDSNLAGAIDTISVMELCRFENDAFPIVWSSALGQVEISAHVVQR